MKSKKHQVEEISSIIASYPLSKVSEDPTIKRWAEYVKRGRAVSSKHK
jgi:hypothetical protein